MSGPIIKAENYSYIYPDTENLVLKNVSFEIHEGEFVGIVGCNKAGKSTLCQSVVGVIPHAMGGQWDGKIFVDGLDLDETKGVGATDVIGIVFQDAESQFTQETVEDEIAFAMCNFGFPRDLMVERVRQAATDCGLFDMLDRSPFKLSGGQQQRLAVACILALQPRVIILDESTSQLDPVGRDEVFGLVTRLHKQGRTIIMVDHNIEKIAEYVDKVMIMHAGEVKYFDDAKKIFTLKEELAACNVRLPQVADAALSLKDRYPLREIPIKLQEAVALFQDAMKGVTV